MLENSNLMLKWHDSYHQVEVCRADYHLGAYIIHRSDNGFVLYRYTLMDKKELGRHSSLNMLKNLAQVHNQNLKLE